MKKFYILFILASFIIVPTGTTYAQELMVNNGLEQWDDPSTPTDWDNAENISQESSFIHGGSYSAAHTSESSSKDLQQVVQGIVGGANYTISYYFLDNVTDAKTRIWSYWLEDGATLTENELELRPSEYSVNNADWQLYTVTLTAPANANGFRFEVRVYHEDNNTGGMVYYDDFSVMAAGVAPEPTNYPTDFSASASGISINLDWTDAIGDQLPSAYLIKASTTAAFDLPVDGIPVDDDTDLSDGEGALNIGYGQESCSFGDLGTNTTIYFAIYPYTNGGAGIDYKTDGTPPEANATTADLSIIESENFNDGFGDWTRVSVVGDLEWVIDPIHGVGDTPCAKCTGYDGGAAANEDWLISPPMNFNNYTQEVLSFFTADAYDGPALEAMISNDYDGSDPTTATWTNLEFETSTGFFEWISSGDIDVSSINGDAVYIAFKFTSTNQESATWEVDDILITGTEGASSVSEPNALGIEIGVYPNPANDNVNIVANSHEKLNISIYSMLGAKVHENSNFSGSVNIDLSGLNDGIYFIQISDQKGNTGTKKLLIEK